MFPGQMHHIQKEIISSLAHNAPQRFSDLQPPRIPNNTFSYHLKKLTQAGYVNVADGGYIATRKALQTLQYANLLEKRTSTPVFISAVNVTNSAGQVLLLKHNNPPFIGWYGVPAGLVHQGEHLQDAAIRELFEKASIKARDVSFAGVLDFQYIEPVSNDLFVHTIAFVYSYRIAGNGDQLEGAISHYGTLMWSDLSEDRILPEVYTIAELTKREAPFIESTEYVEPSIVQA